MKKDQPNTFIPCPTCGKYMKADALSRDQVRAIYEAIKMGTSINEIAEITGKTKQLMYAIKNRKFRSEWTNDL